MSSADTRRPHAWWRTPRPVTGAVAGAAATAVAYFVFLQVLGRAEASHHVGPLPVSAERLLPYGIALGERLVPAGQDAAHVLERISTLAPWLLVALGLLRLVRRDQTLYVRFASALVLSFAAHLVVLVAGWGAPVRELPLVQGYWTLPAVRASWYVLLALTATATTARAWPRAAVTLVATVEVTLVVLGADRQLLSVLSAAVIPLVAWYSAGRLRHRDTKTPEPQVDSKSLPLPPTQTTPAKVFIK